MMTDLSAIQERLVQLRKQLETITSPEPPRVGHVSPAKLARNEVDRKGAMLKSNRPERFDSYINARILKIRTERQAAKGKATVKPPTLHRFNGELATFIGVTGHEHHGILRPPSRYGVQGMWELRTKANRLICAFHHSDVIVTIPDKDTVYQRPVLTHKRYAHV